MNARTTTTTIAMRIPRLDLGIDPVVDLTATPPPPENGAQPTLAPDVTGLGSPSPERPERLAEGPHRHELEVPGHGPGLPVVVHRNEEQRGSSGLRRDDLVPDPADGLDAAVRRD